MSSHEHDDHGHDHARTFQPDHAEPTTAAARVGLALRELLIEAGYYSAEEEQAMIARMQGARPENGAVLVARAWTDPAFRQRLLANGAEAIREFGFDLSPTEFTVVENTDSVHNVIVCTLCSCYPRELLGLPPSWYKSRQYRARVVREPRTVLKEFGTELPDDVEIRVHDSTADIRYLVVPQQPEGTEGMSAEELESLITRDSMIGVTEVKAPS